MALEIGGALIALGTALVPTATGATAGFIGGAAALSTVSTVASAGIGIAQAAGAFDKKVKTPSSDSPSSGEAALRARKTRQAANARNRNVFAGSELGPAPNTKQTALFGPASAGPQ